MTDKEKELYEQIKSNPKHILFEMFFNIDDKGEIIPIKGMTFKLMPDGIPLVWNSTIENFFNENSSNDPFAKVRTNKSFREISNEIAMKRPFGKESIFYREEREILKGEIPKL